MSARDPVIAVLEALNRPATPRAEFADALRERLLTELVHVNGTRARPKLRRPRVALRPRRLAPVVAGLALAALVAAVVAIVASRPSPASALDVIHDARLAFGEAPPFRATLRVQLDPDGATPDVPKGATSKVVISYDGRNKFRSEIAAIVPPFPTATGVGSYTVYDGRMIGSFDSKTNRFTSTPAPNGYAPLKFFSWQSKYPDWDRVCRGPDSKVLPDVRIAGRDARHIRCGDFRGEGWELWIDKEMGLLLKIVGPFGGDDSFGNLGAGVTGGFEVRRLRLDPQFPAGTFSTQAPENASDWRAALRTAAARVPPVHLVVYRRSRQGTISRELWWRDPQTWRIESHGGKGGSLLVPAARGSFSVLAGGKERIYNARDKTYYPRPFPGEEDPIWSLLPGTYSGYSSAGCRAVGRDRIAGREAVHRRCRDYELWLDTSTGLILRALGPHQERGVRRIQYRPSFPQGTFRFVPPPGAVTPDKLEIDPYRKTRLTPGRPAPNWSAMKLGGGRFEIKGLRGKPALLLFIPDWCPAGDPVCDVFPTLQRVHERSKGAVNIFWVDWEWPKAEEARKVVRHNHLTFSVVIDARDASRKAWGGGSWPYWVLLDSRGRVVEARLKPQTTAQLEQLLARARR